MSSRSSKSEIPVALPEFIAVGRIRKPHGVRGEVSVGVLSDVRKRFAVGSSVDLVLPDGNRQTARIATVRGSTDDAIVRFEGVETRDQADGLRSAVVEIERERVPEAPPGMFYYFELAGCDCHDKQAGHLGRVIQVIEDGGGLLLEVEGGSRRLLVPFVESYIQDVNIAARRIELELPEGLVETCTSGS